MLNKTSLTITNNKLTLSEDEVRRCTYRLLKSMSADPALAGFSYTIEAVTVLYLHAEKIKQITTKDGLYASVGKTFNKTAMQIERGIRHMIEKITYDGNMSVMKEIFGEEMTKRKTRASFVTNATFLVGIVNYLTYEYDNIPRPEPLPEEV